MSIMIVYVNLHRYGIRSETLTEYVTLSR